MSLSPLKQRSAEGSDHKEAPEQSSLISMGREGASSSGESILLSNVGVFDSCDQVFASTPIHPDTPRRRLTFTSNSRSPTEAGKMVESGDRQTCHENELEDLRQDLHNTKKELWLEKRANTSLEKQNQVLLQENYDLREHKETLLNENSKQRTQLSRAKELSERETFIEILPESAQVDMSQLIRENSLLKKEMGMLNNEFKRTSRSQETKNLGIQTEDMGELEEGAESNLRHKVEDLKKMIGILSEKNKELTLNNSFLEEKVKLLESKSEASQLNSTGINLLREMEEDDQQQIGTLDRLTQMGINSEFNSETTVPIKNEELSSAIQDFARNTNGPARLTEELENKNKELIHENQSLNAKTQAQLEKLQKDSDAKTKEFESAKAQLERERDSASENLTQEQRKTSQLNDQVGTLTEELDRIKAQLKEKEEEISELNGRATQLIKKEKALDDAKKKVSNLEYETLNQQASINDLTKERDQLASETNTLTEKLKNESKKLDDANQALDTKISEVTQLTKQNSQLEEQLRKELNNVFELGNQVTTLTKELKEKKAELERENSSLVSQVGELKGEFEGIKTNLAGKEEELRSKIEEVAELSVTVGKLERQKEELMATQAEFETEKAKLKSELTKRDEVLESTQARLKQEVSSLKGQVTQLAKEKDQLAKQLNDTQQNPNPDNENKKLLAVSAQSRKQITYASVSFVLSGAFAVGASLTMFHLTICISLAVAALTFLAVGCYCSYKANTALSDVGIDQINDFNPPSVGV